MFWMFASSIKRGHVEKAGGGKEKNTQLRNSLLNTDRVRAGAVVVSENKAVLVNWWKW